MSDSHTMRAGDGEVTVKTHRGRVLAVTLPGVAGNMIYEDAHGAGGDRLWIAPEAAYHWEDVDEARKDPFKAYTVPANVDPGRYSVEAAGAHHVTLVNRGVELTDRRVGKTIRFDVERSVHAIHRPEGLPGGLKVASFAITNTLRLVGGDDGAVAGAWDILQVPRGGVLVCPTVRAVCQPPTSYYDPFGDSVSWAADAVRFFVDGKSRMKMGLPPEVTTGRMGYLLGDTLIVRVFAPLVGETYVDVPLSYDRGARRGPDCLQAYSDDDTFGPFGEMEYHDPAIVVGRGPVVRSGTCVTHAIAGDGDAVREAAAMLLGVKID